MNAKPVAYLRRSFVDVDSPGDISRDLQRAAVQKLAAADGHIAPLTEYDDWGVSADAAKASKRTAYARLLADMEAGRISAVYAFDVDRLYRDPRDLIRLQDAAQRFAVRIVTTGGALAIGDGDDPAAEAFAFIGAVFGRLELQKAKKRARAGLAARRARGDRLGHAPYGYRHERQDGRIVVVRDPSVDLDVIRAAYIEAGSILGACRILEKRGVVAPKGGSRWATSALTRIIEREWPGLLPRVSRSGLRTPTSALLAQLLRCPFCGRMLTPNMARGQYYCSDGPYHRDTHPRYAVREIDVAQWVRAEAERFRLIGEDIERDAANDAERVRLAEKRERVIDSYTDGVIDKDERTRRLAALDAEVAALADDDAIRRLPAVDWGWRPGDINAILREMFDYIELGPDLLPVRAAWRVPAEYVA